MKTLKPYHGIITIILSLIILFFIGPVLGARFGLYGSLMGEILLLIGAVAVVILAKSDLKKVFPIYKPRIAHLGGCFLLWCATLLAGMIITLILSYFYPKEVLGMSQGLSTSFLSESFLVTFFIVAISPAICEEAVFRGVLLNSFLPLKNKWVIIILTGVIFGAFHGSIFRFFPTALLGILFAYMVLETGNLFYSILFHGLNNGSSVILLYISQNMLKAMGINGLENVQMEIIPLSSIGSYIIMGSMIPFGLYIGNYLIHRGQENCQQTLFPKDKITTIMILVVITVAIFLIGMGTVLYGLFSQPEVINDFMKQLI